MLTGINLNNGEYLQFGDIAFFNREGMDGYNPVSEIIPNTLKFANYKPVIDTMPVIPIYTWDVFFSEYDSEEQLGDLVDGVREYLENGVVWVWGNPEDGGMFLANSGSSEVCYSIVWSPTWRRSYTNPQTQEEYYKYMIYINSATWAYYEEAGTPAVRRPVELAFFNLWQYDDLNRELYPPANDFQVARVSNSLPLIYESTDKQVWELEVEVWRQTQAATYVNWDNFRARYLTNYTTENNAFDMESHPWARYIQNRIAISGTFQIDFLNPNFLYDRISGLPVGGAGEDETGNPYGGIPSGEGGGDGDHSLVNDIVGDGGLPSSLVLTTGMARLYLPTTANMQAFSQWLYHDASEADIGIMKRLFVNPMDGINSLNLVHLNIPYTASAPITFAGVSSGVNSPYAATPYHKVKYGLKLNEFWGSYLDYGNNTRVKIYVPYAGIFDLNNDEIQAGKLTCTYKIDLLTGSATIMIGVEKLQKNGSKLDSILYEYNANVFQAVPLSATDWRGYYQSLMQMAASLVNPSGVNLGGLVNAAMQEKVHISKGSNFGSNYGYLGVQTPYLMIERPMASIPSNYGHSFGYPSNVAKKIKLCKGFFKATAGSFRTENIPNITDSEAAELKQLVESGVIL